MTVTLQREARIDLEDAAKWYEGKVPGLGHEFLQEVESSFERITEFTDSYPIIYRSIRRCALRRFPFCIFFTSDVDTINVFAVMHASRDPSNWKTRV